MASASNVAWCGARAPQRRRFGHAEVYAAIAALAFLVARFLPLLELPYVCPFKALTRLPCAACGMTHAFVHLAHGEIAAAFAASPLGATAAAMAWVLVVADVLRLALALPLPHLGRRAAITLARAGVAAVLVNWVFLLLSQRS